MSECPKCDAGMIVCPLGACGGHWPNVDGPCDSPMHHDAEAALARPVVEVPDA